MAESVVDTENSIAPERTGPGEHQLNGSAEAAATYQPLSKVRLQAALDAIPKDRDPEMMSDFANAAASGSRDQILAAMLRWVGIGDFYADPDREKNHPLASLAGSLKDSPELKVLMKRLAKARRRKHPDTLRDEIVLSGQ